VTKRRIATERRPIGILWCSNQRMRSGNGWCFPPAVDRHLRTLTAGQTVYHSFGGRAKFGLRGDIDPLVRPDVIADAWLPPFGQGAFDVVILDPPYVNINQQMKNQLLRSSAFIARKRVIWFHTMWIAGAGQTRLRLERSWLVRVGDSCAVRCIQVFTVLPGAAEKPVNHFERGPAIKYNRWLVQPERLPLGRQERSA
jgi:hypothetical protein